VIEKHHIGYNYSPGDADGLYQAVKLMATHPQQRNQLSSNALNYYKDHGDSDKVYSNFAEYIENFVESQFMDNLLYN